MSLGFVSRHARETLHERRAGSKGKIHPTTPTDESAIRASWGRISQRFSQLWAEHDALDAWRYQQEPLLRQLVWGQMGRGSDLPLVVRNEITSATDTIASFLAGQSPPKIQCIPRNTHILDELKTADFNEKIGLNVFHEIDYERAESLIPQVADYACHRAQLIAKLSWKTPGERGEEHFERQAADHAQAALLPFQSGFGSLDTMLAEREGEGEPGPARGSGVSANGEFPVDVQLIDGRECAYVLDRNKRTIEFIHRYECSLDQLYVTFPDLLEHPEYSPQLQGPSSSTSERMITVIDYWNRYDNAIVIQDFCYKEPTPHHYVDDDGKPFCPVVIEEVKVRRIREGQYQLSERPAPFCVSILDAMKWAAWADSLSAMLLAKTGFGIMKLRGLTGDGSDNYHDIDENGDVIFAPPEGVFELGWGGVVVPLYGEQDLDYLKPPEVINVLQEFKSTHIRNIEIVTFAESILSGLVKAELSGVSASLQTQAAMARIEPYRHAMNRFLSRLLVLTFVMLRGEWDREGPNGERASYFLNSLSGTGEDELSPEMVNAVGHVKVEVIPDVRVDRERESKELYEGMTLGVVSQLTVIDRLGYVESASDELERIAFEKMAQTDPQIGMVLAHNYMRKNKIGPYSDDAGSQGSPQLPGSAPAGAGGIPGAPGPADALSIPGAPGPAAPGQVAPPGVPGVPGLGAPAGGPALGGPGGAAGPLPGMGLGGPAMGAGQMPGGAGGQIPPELMQLLMQDPAAAAQMLGGSLGMGP